MISAATVRPSVDFRLPPSPASRMSPSVTLSPALPSSFSTTILSPGATRYCLPPVRTTANIFSSLLLRIPVPRRRRLAKTPAAPGSAPPMAGGSECQPPGLVPVLRPQLVAAALEPIEHARNARVIDRLIALVGQQILVADISDVGRFRIFGQQVIERLVLGWP